MAEFELSQDKSQLVHPGLRAEYERRARIVDKKRQAGQKRWDLKAVTVNAEPQKSSNGGRGRESQG